MLDDRGRDKEPSWGAAAADKMLAAGCPIMHRRAAQ